MGSISAERKEIDMNVQGMEVVALCLGAMVILAVSMYITTRLHK